jgi:hypothetical protein
MHLELNFFELRARAVFFLISGARGCGARRGQAAGAAPANVDQDKT